VAERPQPTAPPAGAGETAPAAPAASGPEASPSGSQLDPVGRLIERASAGDRAAQHDLGMLHLSGNGVKRDPAEAARWFERAAKQGLPNAQANLGVMYRDGTGVKEDEQVAAFWFQSAAEQGFARAQHNLAIAYARGNGFPKSERLAVNWFTRAAESGLSDSQYSLGLIYDRGLGDVKADLAKAREWYAKAAAQGDTRSAERLKMLDNLVATKTPADKPAAPATAPPADNRPLARTEIRELQSLLNSLGFDAGPADGQIGPKTTSAITLYQKFAGFDPDGKATREPLLDLRAVAQDVPNRR
jgi:localization factor PodJL